MRAVKRQTIQQCSAATKLLDEVNVSTDSVLRGLGGMTHLGMEMTYQVQQLLNTPLKGRRVTTGFDAQRQSVCVQQWEVANYPGVCRGRLDSPSSYVRLCVRLNPAVK